RSDPEWFQESKVSIYDLGLLPRQLTNRSVFVQQSWDEAKKVYTLLTPPVRASLQPDEIKWLEDGKYVELESFTPQPLLRVVTQGIAKSRDPQSSDALVPVDTGDTVIIYAYDSFG